MSNLLVAEIDDALLESAPEDLPDSEEIGLPVGSGDYDPDDGLRTYFREVGGTRLLTADDERRLASRIEDEAFLRRLGAGDDAARRAGALCRRLAGEWALVPILRQQAGLAAGAAAASILTAGVVRQKIDAVLDPDLVAAVAEADGLGSEAAAQRLIALAIASRIAPAGVLADLSAVLPTDGAPDFDVVDAVVERRRSELLAAIAAVHRRAEAARHELTESNLRLVISLAQRYRSRTTPLLDLIQEGNIGLMLATDKYNHRLGFRFSTYATWWIKQSIGRALAKRSHAVHLPIYVVGMINRLGRVSHRLAVELGREPTRSELALAMGFLDEPLEAELLRLAGGTPAEASAELEAAPAAILASGVLLNRGQLPPAIDARIEQATARVSELLEISQEPLSLETPVGSAEDTYLGEVIVDRETDDPADVATQQVMRSELQQVLGKLRERERRALEMRFGLDNGQRATLEEVGRALGVTREAVRQIEARAIRKLRKVEFVGALREFLD